MTCMNYLEGKVFLQFFMMVIVFTYLIDFNQDNRMKKGKACPNPLSPFS